jgi:2-desacetyl-2-hydroxyethyl bacteriochlorophyllide A dehydrogenase
VLSVQVTSPGQLKLVEAAEPDPAGEALVRVHRVGICGTDLKILNGGIPVDYPRIMGHEMVGEVVQPGPAGITVPGQRVLVDPGIVCGHCRSCRAGRPNLCTNGGLMGRDVDGVFAGYVAVPETRLFVVPATVSDAASGLLQVLATCIHAQQTVSVAPGDVAVVVGLGVAGLLFVQLLHARGARVVGVTRSSWKRELAAGLGAEAVATPDEASRVVGRLSSGHGADVVVEAVGTEATLAQAVDLAAPGSEVVVFGTIVDGGGAGGAGAGPRYYQMYFNELTLHFPRAALPIDYQRGVELAASGTLQLEPLVTDRLGLTEAEEAFAVMQRPSSLKVLMDLQY